LNKIKKCYNTSFAWSPFNYGTGGVSPRKKCKNLFKTDLASNAKIDAMTMCPRTMWLRTKSLVCSVPWTMRPLDDASLEWYVIETMHPLNYTSLGWCAPLDVETLTNNLTQHKVVCPKGSGHIIQGRII
jgi:hypothetical protein